MLVSVHVFHLDPTWGLLSILGFLLAVIEAFCCCSLPQGSQVKSHGKHEPWTARPASRSKYPAGGGPAHRAARHPVALVHKGLGQQLISIGTPFFNHIYSWLIIPSPHKLGWAPVPLAPPDPVSSGQMLALVPELRLRPAVACKLFAEVFKPLEAALGIGLWRLDHRHQCRDLGAGHHKHGLPPACATQQPLEPADPGARGTHGQHHRHRLHPELQHREGPADAGHDRVQFADYEFVFTGISEKNSQPRRFQACWKCLRDGKIGSPAQTREADTP